MKPAGFTEAGNNVFYQDCNRNWIEVMSDNKWLWFCKVSKCNADFIVIYTNIYYSTIQFEI